MTDPTRLDYAPPGKGRKPPFTLADLAVSFVIGLALFLGGILAVRYAHDSHHGPSGTAAQHRCAFNLKEIHKSIEMYARQHDGSYPPDFEALLPGLVPDLMWCSGDSTPDASGSRPASPRSYVYRAAGVTSSTVTPRHVIAHDKPTNHAGQRMNVLFGDGTVEWLDATAAKKLIAELDAGHNPPRN